MRISNGAMVQAEQDVDLAKTEKFGSPFRRPSSGLVWVDNGNSEANVPLGAEKWMTFPSLLNMLTSSMA